MSFINKRIIIILITIILSITTIVIVKNKEESKPTKARTRTFEEQVDDIVDGHTRYVDEKVNEYVNENQEVTIILY